MRRPTVAGAGCSADLALVRRRVRPYLRPDAHAPDPMNDAFYTSRSSVVKIEGVHRRATLTELGTTIEFGVHGPIKRHYRLDDAKDLPLPVDYVVAATGT